MATDPADVSPAFDPVTGVRNVGEASDSEPPYHYQPGEVIDEKFELIRRVGSGGMGTVWVAHNLVLDVQVGIKLITFRGTKNRHALALRLLDEARSAARLGHPAVIKIHDFGITDRGDPFIAMELLGGEDLAQLLEREAKLSPETAIQMLLPIAHGLAAAHDKGIVHRDIKPENVFLSHDDDGEIRPKLLDFGIARLVDNPTKLTLEGTPLGTPEYMSPELARGQVAEATSDIWSFTVVLYELVSGVCPFQAVNYNALMQSILHDDPIDLETLGDFDPALLRIIAKGLKKNPTERWESMRELGAELATLLLKAGISEDICGTSLRRAWQLPEAEAVPNSAEVTRLAEEQPEAPLSAPQPPSQQSWVSHTDEYQLTAIAEMNRGGDPVEVLARAERRRSAILAAGVVVFCLMLVGSILIGTGVLD